MVTSLVSVIITTKNEEKVIKKLLISFGRQTYKNWEIILVDNNSTDKTVEIAKDMGVKVYNFGPERSAQRNFGARIAKGEYLLFVDADMELSENVLNECIEVCFKNPDIGGVAIPEKSKAIYFWEKVKAFERSFYNEKGDPITDAARFFKKEVFQKAGGYDETITGPEDWDLPETIIELGFRINRIKAHIYHRERVPSPWILAKKKFYYALSSYKYLEKHNISIVSSKTIYFLRPVFYRNWKKLLMHPVLTPAMIIMLSAELLGGGLGYILGRLRKL